MKVHVTILGSTCEVDAVRAECESMDSTEMPKNFSQLLIIDDAHHFDLETSFFSSSCGYITGILTSCKQYMEFLVVC